MKEKYQVKLYNLFNHPLRIQEFDNREEALQYLESQFQYGNAGFLFSRGVLCTRSAPDSPWCLQTLVINAGARLGSGKGEELRVCYYNGEDEICRMESCPEPLAKEALQESIREHEVYAVLSYRKTWENESEISDEWLTIRVVVHPEKEPALLLERPMHEPIQF